MAMDIDERQELALEVYRGKRTGTLGRGGVNPVLGKSPPRPSPASVAYHSDDDSLKAYDENPDDSSLTEKPSEISSSDSQVSQLFSTEILVTFHNIMYRRLRNHLLQFSNKNFIGMLLQGNSCRGKVLESSLKCLKNVLQQAIYN